MNRKGQSSVEFLLSYGWAIGMGIALIGAFAYFGVFSSSITSQERCVGPLGFSCEDFIVDDGKINFLISNNLGFEVDFLSYLEIQGFEDTHFLYNSRGVIAGADEHNCEVVRLSEGHDISSNDFFTDRFRDSGIEKDNLFVVGCTLENSEVEFQRSETVNLDLFYFKTSYNGDPVGIDPRDFSKRLTFEASFSLR